MPLDHATFDTDGYASLRLWNPPEKPVVGELAFAPVQSGNLQLVRVLEVEDTGTDSAGDEWFDVQVRIARRESC